MREVDFAQEALTTLKNHQYTCLVDTDEVEVWKCARSNSVHSYFTITMTNMGMCFMGDYDAVVFRVGKDYGLPFLARGVDSYFTSKLEEISRSEVEFDEEKALEAISDYCRNAIENEGLPKPAEGQSDIDYARHLVDTSTAAGAFDELDSLVDFYDDVKSGRIERIEQFYEELQGLPYTEVDDYPTVSSFTDSLMRRLHMINHAAKAILAIKYPNQPVEA